MQLGLTWPLQRLLKVSVPYGESIHRGLCWDAHCIMLCGRSSLLLVHCESRYTCVCFDFSPMEWGRLDEIALEEIQQGLLDAGIPEEQQKDRSQHGQPVHPGTVCRGQGQYVPRPACLHGRPRTVCYRLHRNHFPASSENHAKPSPRRNCLKFHIVAAHSPTRLRGT